MKIPFDTNTVRVTSPYGQRKLNGKNEFHGGYDLVGVGSTDVVAAVGGTVVTSQIITDRSNLTWQWGNYVCVKTDAGQYHYYCHLASRAVKKGQHVKEGDKLGVMGSTGYSFGAHLHFEARGRDGRTTISPEEVLGIPNEVGHYKCSELDSDVATLQKHGIITTPAYWKNTAPKVKYLGDLIHNMARKLSAGNVIEVIPTP